MPKPKLETISKDIEKAIETDNSELLAKSYMNSAAYYKSQKNYTLSEDFYKKAIVEYQKNGNKEALAVARRELALVLEWQNKKNEALNSLKMSNEAISKGEVLSQINANDIKRLNDEQDGKKMTIQSKKKLIKDNIKLNEKINNTEEVTQAYTQIADLELQQNNTQEAVKNYNIAYDKAKEGAYSNSPSNELRNINQKLTDVYVKDKNYDKAIETKHKILTEPSIKNNTLVQAKEIKNLADIYILRNESKRGLELLNQSYNISIQNGHTLEAKMSVEKLVDYYQSQNDLTQALRVYQDFLKKLPTLIEKDSNIEQNRLIKNTEEKINRLIKERELKEQLIQEKNFINYGLIGLIVLLLFLFGLLLYIIKTIRRKNKQIELQSLRREMNPHFIFNSLNSINQFIATNNEREANNYLTKFSKLMRGIMENSKDDFISIAKEIEVLENYLALEKSRFSEKFEYHIEVNGEFFEKDSIKIPSMIIQPHIENAIWHGLRYTTEQGLLRVKFYKELGGIAVTIEDNGIGIENSKKMKTKHQKTHEGRGLQNTLERIHILNNLYNVKIICKIQDKIMPNTGVIVYLWFPIN